MKESPYDVIIIGAGPCGLACAIEAQKAGLKYTVIEKGNITESIRRYPMSMTFFSTSENIEIGEVPMLSHGARPNRTEALKYYRKVVSHYKLDINSFTEVLSINGVVGDFSLQTNKGIFKAEKIIIATGYYDLPKLLDIPGENMPHVSHYYDEAFKYTNTKVVVVGGANSATEAALDLYRNGANVTVVHMLEGIDERVKYWIRPDLVNRIKKNEIDAYFNSKVKEIGPKAVSISTPEGPKTIDADFVFLMTGYRPDIEFLKSVGIELQGENHIPVLNIDSLESSKKGIFLAGSILGGEETSKIFIENGRLHGKEIIKFLK